MSKRGQFVTIANHKGGVGKTTTTYTLGLGLASRGYRVVMVDADAQATLTSGALGMEPEPCFYDLIVRKNVNPKDVLRPIPPEWYSVAGQPAKGQALLIPGNTETRNVADSLSDPFAVYHAFESLLDAVDFIILDASPTESMLHPLCYVASDAVLHPTQCVEWSLDSLYKTMGYVRQTQPYRRGGGLPEIKTLGILPTMFRNGVVLQRDLLADLAENNPGLVWEPIAMRVAWQEAALDKAPVFATDPSSEAATEAWRMIDQFLAALGMPVGG